MHMMLISVQAIVIGKKALPTDHETAGPDIKDLGLWWEWSDLGN